MAQLESMIDVLNAAFTRKYYSMAEYIVEAKPFVRAGQEAVVREIEAIADADRALKDPVAEAIQALGGIPQLGLYDPEVANLNYLSLDFLVKELIRTLEKEAAEYAEALSQAGEYPEAKEVLGRLRDAAQAALGRLRGMQA